MKSNSRKRDLMTNFRRKYSQRDAAKLKQKWKQECNRKSFDSLTARGQI